jgi:hypothetical protein
MGIRGAEFPDHGIVSVQTVVDEDPDLADVSKRSGKNVAGVASMNLPGGA